MQAAERSDRRRPDDAVAFRPVLAREVRPHALAVRCVELGEAARGDRLAVRGPGCNDVGIDDADLIAQNAAIAQRTFVRSQRYSKHRSDSMTVSSASSSVTWMSLTTRAATVLTSQSVDSVSRRQNEASP